MGTAFFSSWFVCWVKERTVRSRTTQKTAVPVLAPPGVGAAPLSLPRCLPARRPRLVAEAAEMRERPLVHRNEEKIKEMSGAWVNGRQRQREKTVKLSMKGDHPRLSPVGAPRPSGGREAPKGSHAPPPPRTAGRDACAVVRTSACGNLLSVPFVVLFLAFFLCAGINQIQLNPASVGRGHVSPSRAGVTGVTACSLRWEGRDS